MSRRAKTIAVLGVEFCLLAVLCASFIYFVRESRDFLVSAPGPAVETGEQPRR